MECVRKTIDSTTLSGIFDIPSALTNKRVEVIILPAAREETEMQPDKGSAFGRLRKYANPSLMPKEKGAWERAVVEKYADC